MRGLKFDNPGLTTAINFFNASKLTLEEVDGRLMVSTQIRDQSGDVVAELGMNGKCLRRLKRGIGIIIATAWR